MKEWPSKLATLIILLAVTVTAAMGQRGSFALRTVRGTVVDIKEQVLSASVVHLRDQRTHAVRTYITDSDGQYRFSGLNPNADYHIHAEYGDWTSSVLELSAVHGKRDAILQLKVDKKKNGVLLLPVVEVGGNIL